MSEVLVAERVITKNDMGNKLPKIIWHKCNNTKMLLEALITQGVAGVEYDVVVTADAVPVLFHDRMIKEKVADGGFVNLDKPLEIAKLTAQELAKLRPDIDPLERAFTEINKINFADDFEFHLEVKPPVTGAWDSILSILQKFSRINAQTIPRSFQENVVAYIKDTAPDRPVCLLLCRLHKDEEEDDVCFKITGKTAVADLPDIEQVKAICGGHIPEYVSINYKIVTAEFISDMQAAGVKVEVYTLNDSGGYASALNLDGIVTDFPVRMLKEIGKYGSFT